MRKLHIHQRENPPRQSLNSEHLCSKCKGTHIHKRKFIKAQNIHQTPHNNNERLHHPTVSNGHVIETETKQRHNESNRG